MIQSRRRLRRRTHMSPETATPVQAVVPAEVLAFAQEKGIVECLTGLIELTRELYPTARKFEVYLEDELAGPPGKFITFDVHIPLSVEESVARKTEWTS